MCRAHLLGACAQCAREMHAHTSHWPAPLHSLTFKRQGAVREKQAARGRRGSSMHSQDVGERRSPHSAPLSAGRASSPLQLSPRRTRSAARRMRCGSGAPEREGSFTQRWKVSEKCSPSSVPFSVELYVATMVLLLASARAARGFGCARGRPSSVRACAALRSCVRPSPGLVYTRTRLPLGR